MFVLVSGMKNGDIEGVIVPKSVPSLRLLRMNNQSSIQVEVKVLEFLVEEAKTFLIL